MLHKQIHFLFLLIFLPYCLPAGNTDSIISVKKNTTTRFFTASQFEYNDSIKYIDNSLYNFQNYLGRDHLGASGLAFNHLYVQPGSSVIGFNYSKNNYENYLYTPAHLKFYNTRTPYTDLLYVIGSKAEQIFKMTFSYNVKKNWNVTVDFSRIRSDGFYKRQNLNHNFIAASSNYRSTNNRYLFLAGIFYNDIKNDENGGITNDSILENSGAIDKKLIDINLASAKRKQLNRTIYFKQYWNFGRRSSDTSAHNAIIPGSRLILTSIFDDHLLKYEDDLAPASYYSNFYYDPAVTRDSAYHSKIENELAWKRTDNKKHRGIKDIIGAGFSIKHQFITIKQREIDTSFSNSIAGAEFFNTYSTHKLWWNVKGNYALSGYNKDDYNVSAVIKKGIIDSLSAVSLKFENLQQTPDFIYHRYSSNHFKWNNVFDQTQKRSMAMYFSSDKYHLAVNIDYSEYTNVVYFDNYAVARQYKGTIGVLSTYLKKDFIVRNWHLNNTIHYQYAPDSTVIRLPQFVLEHALYYENDILKGAAILQIGASVFYTSAYYADAYMPATAQFYLQNNKKYGDYPFIDFFLNAQIKTVRLFIKIDHLNSGWEKNRSMLTPHYPMNDRAFKLGISWRFFN